MNFRMIIYLFTFGVFIANQLVVATKAAALVVATIVELAPNQSD